MNKKEVVKIIAKQTHHSQEQVQGILDLFLSVCKIALVSGEPIKITSFGTLDTKVRPERNSFDFASGKTKKTEPRRVVTFTPCEELAQRVAKYIPKEDTAE